MGGGVRNRVDGVFGVWRRLSFNYPPITSSVRRIFPRVLALLFALSGVGTAQVRGGAPVSAGGPLSGFAGQRVLVVPVQGYRADSGVTPTAAMWDGMRRALDDSLGAAIAATGIGKGWGYAADVVRSAKRNVMYTGDPYALGTKSLSSVTLKGGDQLPEIVASNLRPLIALGDTRLALLPVQLTVERQGARQRARLRLVLVDGRGSTVLWVGEVFGDAVASGSDPLLFSSLVTQVAALAAPR